MGILPNFGNIGKLVASLYPIFIVSFLLLASIFNLKPLTGLTYITGILITYGICYLLASPPLDQNPRDYSKSITCDLFSTFSYDNKSPSFQAAITWFTFIYLLIPMIQNLMLLNPVVIGVTGILAIINMIYLEDAKCSNWFGLLFGMLIGLICGTVYFYIVSSQHKSLLFYNELVSNNVVCKKPAKTNFKCHVYKNGELMSSNMV